MTEKKLIVIVGPTAVGKTAVAVQLASHFNTEIVSADARQIYRELVIGTAKPAREELEKVRHHFIDHISIQEEYDAGIYSREAGKTIATIFSTHDAAVLCGGSGLYVKAVLEGFDELPEIPSSVRAKIIEEYKEKGLPWLQEQVAEQDPDYFDAVDKQNPQRLMRALEVIRSTGKSFSGFRKGKGPALPYQVIKLGIELGRETLYARIDTRMDEMIRHGLFEEAEGFYGARHLNALQTVGYQEIFGFLDGLYDREEAIRLLKRNSRRYAKRQMTWFRKDKEIHWVFPDEFDKMLKLIGD